jgi:hypothetical protein
MKIQRILAVLAGVALGAAGLASPAYAAPTHHYVAAVEAAGTANPTPAGTTGASGIFTIEQPTVAADDYHSLMEISACKWITVSGSFQRNCVEFGWEVNPGVYGDANPHLFSGWWKHGVFQGRNNCVDAAGTPNAGSSILGDVGTMKTFGINYYSTTPAGGGWWFSYNPTSGPTTWVCHIPQSRWTNPGPGGLPSVTGFTDTDQVQWFGEVAEEPGAGESQMGDGSCGSTGTAPLSPATDPAYIAVMRTFQGASTFTNANPYKYSTDPTKWDHASTGTTSMTLGGEGVSC